MSWAPWLPFTSVPAWCAVLPVRCAGAPWLLFSGVPARCFLLRVRCPGAPWLLFSGVPARCFLLRGRCLGPLGSSSPVCPLGVLCCVCGVLVHLAPLCHCARSVRCNVCAVSWATWFLFTGVSTSCFVLPWRCPGPLGSCSPVCPLGALCCLCSAGATWFLFTFVSAPCVVLRVRCPEPLGYCSAVYPLRTLCCVCGVLGPLVPAHWCACSVRCVACAASWASWLLLSGVPARCVVLRVRRPGPIGSCSPVYPPRALSCVCGVLGPLVPVHWCACLVRCVACAASLASWLLFTGAPARCVVLRVRCPGPLGSCLLVCMFGALCCV